MNDPLPALLNTCHALIDSGFSSINECANEISETPQRVSEWITQRAHRPSGKVALKLQQWAAHKTVQLSMVENRDKQTAYRAAYEAVCKRRN